MELNGERFQLSRETPLDRDYTDEEAAHIRAVLAETVGAWADLDTDQMIADLYRHREMGSRP